MKRAFIIVDAQYDFMPGGALPVPDGDKIVPVINRVIEKFDLVVFTMDWHPANHCSFKENGGIWPVHCVQNTPGAQLHGDFEKSTPIILKGQDVNVDSYSGFYDNERKKSTGLAELLRKRGIDTVFIAGLALDYCVKFTALDAVSEGFKTKVIADACKGVNVNPGDVGKAVKEMASKGIKAMGSDKV